jgi:hypothetical protein
MKKLTLDKAREQFNRAVEKKRRQVKRQLEDFEYRLGKQWKPEDEATLKGRGIKALTVNLISPLVNLITGLERQNRTDFRAFPEGAEDSLDAEITTRLFKNAMKQSEGEHKFSEMFEDAITCGESYLELYIDNTFNLVNGNPKWKKLDFDCIYIDPASREYDLSDAKYVDKLTKGLSKDDWISLYPEKESKIEKLNGGRIDMENVDTTDHIQGRDYPDEATGVQDEDKDPSAFDLVEHYYKNWQKRFYCIDMETGSQEIYETAKEAEMGLSQKVYMGQQQGIAGVEARFRIWEKHEPEIWVMAFTGGIDEPLFHGRAESYCDREEEGDPEKVGDPLKIKYRSFPFIPCYARYSTAPLTGPDRHLKIQGIVHSTKDSQYEYNKRKTKELNHLDSSTNSGWLTPKNAWVNREDVKNFGATPGINLEYDPAKGKPERIFPMALNQGYAQLAMENKQEIKDETGINTDLLAAQEGGSDSGRAIALRQRQGLVMVQSLFDNLSRTKKIAARILLSRLKDVFDANSAIKVLGSAFIEKHFAQPDQMTGQMAVDRNAVQGTILRILNDTDFGVYDVSVGEAVYSETMRIANFSELRELAQAMPGLISPTTIVEESNLPHSIKSRVLNDIQQAQQAQIQQQRAQMAAAPQPDVMAMMQPGGPNAPR